MHPPCLCGESYPVSYIETGLTQSGAGGTETVAWAHAAGLWYFKTFYARCQKQLIDPQYNVQWPLGVDVVDLGFGDPIKRPGT